MRSLRFATGKLRSLRLRISADICAAFRSAVDTPGAMSAAARSGAIPRSGSPGSIRLGFYGFGVRSDALQRGFAEFVGAFALVFVGAGSIAATGGQDLTAIALAHGLVIGVMASAVGHISGGHFNPAVTLGFLVARRIEPMLAAVYWVSQFLAATIAALLLSWLLPESSVNATKLGVPVLGSGIGA